MNCQYFTYSVFFYISITKVIKGGKKEDREERKEVRKGGETG